VAADSLSERVSRGAQRSYDNGQGKNTWHAFLLGADGKRYGKLIEDLENDYVQKNDRILRPWLREPFVKYTGSKTEPDARPWIQPVMAFANVSDDAVTTQQDSYSGSLASSCQQMGHFASTCEPLDSL
jgi:hypothetical protein